jgi:predicted short-subunit dehydrogenase-like oxidoreductase (DUF2520 family)
MFIPCKIGDVHVIVKTVLEVSGLVVNCRSPSPCEVEKLISETPMPDSLQVKSKNERKSMFILTLFPLRTTLLSVVIPTVGLPAQVVPVHTSDVEHVGIGARVVRSGARVEAEAGLGHWK